MNMRLAKYVIFLVDSLKKLLEIGPFQHDSCYFVEIDYVSLMIESREFLLDDSTELFVGGITLEVYINSLRNWFHADGSHFTHLQSGLIIHMI